jgi:hypothetical protein
VRTIRKAVEDEVLDSFWAAELAAASRWSRAEVAERERQWRERDGLFGGFPHGVEWERVALTREEVLAILYINRARWLELSGGTRLPGSVDSSHADRAIAATAAKNPELILVSDPQRAKLVLLEGHVRLTSYATFPEHLPDELEAYLGVSSRIGEWCQW